MLAIPRDHRTKVGVLGVDGAAEVRSLAHASSATPSTSSRPCSRKSPLGSVVTRGLVTDFVAAGSVCACSVAASGNLVSFELQHRKHIEDELTKIVRQQLRNTAHALSRVRDSTAIIDTFDRVRRRYPKQLPEHTYGILRRGLVAARDRSEARAQRDGVVAEAAERLEKTRKSAKKRHPLQSNGLA
jgi:hypothetical protein